MAEVKVPLGHGVQESVSKFLKYPGTHSKMANM